MFKIKEPVHYISDLDSLISEPVYFKLLGKTHILKPMTTKEFFKFVDALATLQKLNEKDKIDNDEAINVYVKLFSSVCDTIGRQEVLKMTNSQLVALMNLIIKNATGELQPAIAEKKTLLS